LKGGIVDAEVIEKRKEIYKINTNGNKTLEVVKENLSKAKEEWEEIKKKGNEFREKYLLDHYHSEVLNEI